MRPRFVDQRIFATTHPAWQPKTPGVVPPLMVAIAYLDTDGQPWLYTEDTGLHPISVPDDKDA